MRRFYTIQRRRFLIDKLQYRLLAVNLFHSFLILMILAAALFVPLMIQLESTTISPAEKQAAAEQFLSLNRRLWPALLLAFVLLALHLVLVSHKIAGPLYRFRQIFEAVGAGNLSVKATIRDRDFLANEADSINAMVAGLRARIQSIQDQQGEVPGLLADLQGSLRTDAVEEMARHIERLGARLEQVKTALDQFKTDVPEARSEGEGPAAGAPPPPAGGPSTAARS